MSASCIRAIPLCVKLKVVKLFTNNINSSELFEFGREIYKSTPLAMDVLQESE